MSRYRLDIEYEGTRYSGWQIQSNARTVQGEIAAALAQVLGTQRFDLQGSGRTDAGVHALAQTAHLEAHTHLRPEALRLEINDRLPADIHVLRVQRAPASFHARHDAVSRTYLYQISQRRTAFGKRWVWWIKDPLDLARMRQMAERFVGFHDFRSFCDKGHRGDTRVKVDALTVEADDDLVLVRIRASHFLWKMVRQIVGVLAEVGRGRLTPRDVEVFFRERNGHPAALTAPPSGLFLARVHYPGDGDHSPVLPLLRVT